MKLLKLDILNNQSIIFTNIFSLNTTYKQTIITAQFIELLQVTFQLRKDTVQCEKQEQIWYWTVSSRRENPFPAQRRLGFNMTMNHMRLRVRIVLLRAYTQLKLIKRRNVHSALLQSINYLQKAVPLATAISWHTQCNALAVWAWKQWCTWENWPGWAGEKNQKKQRHIRCSTKKRNQQSRGIWRDGNVTGGITCGG